MSLEDVALGNPVRTDAPATVERILVRARELDASDVHLSPEEDRVAVRVRRDGALVELEPLPHDLARSLVGRLKTLADLLAYRTDVPQEGRIPAARSPTGGEVRVATYPTILGERVALRLEASGSHAEDIDGLGLAAHVRDGLAEAFAQPDGVVLVTGPSGSGKTTTLYAGLRHLRSVGERRSIVTIEDPVERRIAGIDQTEVDRAAGLGFERALRSLLRQDPDVLLVGEIRDKETASIVFEAGLTGHLVASTIHAGTAPQVFARLLEMGVEPFVLTTCVRGVLAQRLVRRRCPDGPCAACGESGYRGRVPVAEWLPLSEPLRRAVLASGDGPALAEAAREGGARSLADEAAALVESGVTTPEEVQRVLGRS